jgi:hypothetical protein
LFLSPRPSLLGEPRESKVHDNVSEVESETKRAMQILMMVCIFHWIMYIYIYIYIYTHTHTHTHTRAQIDSYKSKWERGGEKTTFRINL